ncbi:hypothetical protein ASO20_01585 [Mycoplasma sp. (ex Biomphalaria glabrata)]|uniref:membrane protein insertase YidC n=1 Tax=Mycoplasma sp. (ex Biomphalaria glabrata) TaxID=1749074 RepID=UPI00073ACD03|nr:membrane protein insertase YidC [Mycoplasma sp. (ex Biomphalaria glabrata)]ALV23342.1 hypothetical protein ASO20_01585 [Mycoplasma sp. (ex Biomphalaria glabrata)]
MKKTTTNSPLINLINQYNSGVGAKPNKWKNIFTWCKRIVFLFLMTFTLWGCVQLMFDNSIMTTNQIGSGFEIITSPQDAYNHHNTDGNNGELAFNPISNWSQAWSHGPFYGLFVWPVATLAIELIKIFGGGEAWWGIVLTILILVIFFRTITLFFTLPQLKLQANMQKSQIKISEIRAKYEGRKDLSSKQQMQAEIMSFYKKNNIKPMALITSSLITLPFFFAVYRSFSALRVIKEAHIGNIIDFNTTILPSIFSAHEWQYLIIAVFLIASQVLSFKLQAILNREKTKKMDEKTRKQYKKQNLIQNIMMVVIIIFILNIQVSLAFYMFFSSIFTACQTYGLHIYQKRRKDLRLK